MPGRACEQASDNGIVDDQNVTVPAWVIRRSLHIPTKKENEMLFDVIQKSSRERGKRSSVVWRNAVLFIYRDCVSFLQAFSQICFEKVTQVVSFLFLCTAEAPLLSYGRVIR